MGKEHKDTTVPIKTLRDESKEAKSKEQVELSFEEKVALEREIRRYVRKIGGYRKGLSRSDKIICAKLLARRNGPLRQKVEIDPEITVPGLDNPTVSNIVTKKVR